MGIGIAALYSILGPTSFAQWRKTLAQQAEDSGLQDVYFCRFALVPTCGIAAIAVNSGNFNSLGFASFTMLHQYILLLIFFPAMDVGKQLPLRFRHWKLDLFDAIALTVPMMLSAAAAFTFLSIATA
jgi:hypothetical protein